MIPHEELSEYRSAYATKKRKAAYMRAYTNDPAHPERKKKSRVCAHRAYHRSRGEPIQDIRYEPGLRRLRQLRDNARKRTPEFRALRNAKLRIGRECLRAEAAKVWDTTESRAMLWRAAKQRAKKKGVPFTIIPEDVVIPRACPVLGIPINPYRSQHGPDSPSIDRLVPALGYTRENIIVVSRRANVLKNESTLEEMEKLVAFYRPLLKK